MMGKLKEGNHFANQMVVVCHLWTWHLFAYHLVNWVFSWLTSRSTFMSHVTPLILSKNSFSIVALCLGIFLVNSMFPSLRSWPPMFKGNPYWYFVSAIKTLCQLPLSQSYGYIIYNIPELCSKFHVVDVGFIIALLRQDYSCRLQLIIHELVLETN